MPSFIGVLTRAPQTRRQIARALYSGGMELRFTEKAREVETFVGRDAAELVIVDVDSLEAPEVDTALAALSSAKRRVPAVLLSLGSDKQGLLALLQRYELSNLVAKHGAIRAVYPVLDERELLVTCNKVIREDIFGIEKYIGSWSVKVHTFTVTSVADKYRVLSELEGFLTDLECPPNVVPEMLTVADELTLNAIVHAPRNPDGSARYEERGPDPSLVLEPSEYVEVAFACDGQRLMFSVSDRFGRLSRDTVYEYISKAFGGRQKVEQKASGAGLGLSMSFKRVHQIVFNIQEQVRTEVIAGWYLRADNASEFRQFSKSMNLFWLPPPGERARRSDSSEAVPRATPPPLPAAPAAAPVRPPPGTGKEAQPTITSEIPAASPAVARSPGAAPAGKVQLLRLSGRIDERFKLNPGSDRVRLDLRALTGVTSGGVLAWIKAVKKLASVSAEIVALPEFMVRAANEVEGLLGKIRVRTVLAPFECRTCVQTIQVECKPDEVLRQTPQPCANCGQPLTFAGMDWDYKGLLEVLGETR